MASSQLENVLDVLKLLPLVLQRDLQLIYELDKECVENEKKQEKLSTHILQHFNDTLSKQQLQKLDLSELQELRDIQSQSHIGSAEKLAIAKQCRDICVSYIQRIDEDLDYIYNEAPAGTLDNTIESSMMGAGSSTLPSTSSMMFDETYNKYGQKSLIIQGQHQHHRQAAQKGIKAPRIDAFTQQNDDVAAANAASASTASISTATGGVSSGARHGGVRRKSAVYAMDSMSVALGDTESDDEESAYLPSHDYQHQSVTTGLANTGISDVNVGDMSDMQIISSNAGEDGGVGGDSGDTQLYCTCHGTSYGEMVACDDDNCRIEWFHFGCVGLKSKPKGKWYCPECTQRRAAQQTAASMIY